MNEKSCEGLKWDTKITEIKSSSLNLFSFGVYNTFYIFSFTMFMNANNININSER